MLSTFLALVLSIPALPVTVKHLTDGDTAIVDDRVLQAPIRIACVDAPEVPHTDQDRQRTDAIAITQFRYGQLAQARIAQLIQASGGAMTINRVGVDQYGRNLVSAQFPQGDWGEILVSEGLAVVYAPNPKQCDLVKLRSLESTARDKGLGFWGVTDGSWVVPSQFRKH